MSLNRIVIIGEAPSKRGDSSEPCGGAVGTVLADVFGVAYEQYLADFDRFNLLDKYPGAEGRGAAFEAEAARAKFKQMRSSLLYRVVVVLGKRAARACELREEFFMWQLHGAAYTVFPHPSGLNTWWNDVENIKRAVTHANEVKYMAAPRSILGERR